MGKPKKKKRKLSAYNMHMSREMKKGRTFKQAVASWKPGSKKSSAKKKPGKSNPKGGTRGMAKNSFSMSKIYSLANKAAFIAPYAAIAMTDFTPAVKVREGLRILTGFDMRTNTWSFESLKQGWLPYVATKVMTAAVPKITSFLKGLF